jgi:hypothetical protein
MAYFSANQITAGVVTAGTDVVAKRYITSEYQGVAMASAHTLTADDFLNVDIFFCVANTVFTAPSLAECDAIGLKNGEVITIYVAREENAVTVQLVGGDPTFVQRKSCSDANPNGGVLILAKTSSGNGYFIYFTQ